MIKISISLNKKLLREFDEVLQDRGYQSRSKGIQDALNYYIIRYQLMNKLEGKKIGLISLIYNPNSTDTIQNLTDIQNCSIGHLSAVLRTYINKKQCLEVMLVKNNLAYIKYHY